MSQAMGNEVAKTGEDLSTNSYKNKIDLKI